MTTPVTFFGEGMPYFTCHLDQIPAAGDCVLVASRLSMVQGRLFIMEDISGVKRIKHINIELKDRK